MAAARARNAGRRLARSLRRACWPLDGTDTCAAARSASLASCPGLGSPAGAGFRSTNAHRWSHGLHALGTSRRWADGGVKRGLRVCTTMRHGMELHGPSTGLPRSARLEAMLSAGEALHLVRKAPSQSAACT